MGNMKRLYQEQVAILASQLEMGGRVNVLTYEEVLDLREMVQNNFGRRKSLKIIYTDGQFQLELIKEEKVVKLDADHMGHLHVVLDQQLKSIQQQYDSIVDNLKEVEESLEDNRRLRIRLDYNRVTAQDLETLEVIEQEMEEIYGS